jgi:hypothetical protein
MPLVLLETDRMRVLLAIALMGFCIAGAARAADLPAGHSGGYFEQPQRSEMVWLYGDEPGVVVRTYWSAPWHYHHYFPATGIRPRVGRYENLSAVRRAQKPALSYRRSWSNNWAIEHLYAVNAQPYVIEGDIQADVQRDTRSSDRHRPHAHGFHGTPVR